MSSENPSGAENQQETAKSMLTLDPHWLVGFVDGEGCFSVSIHRNLGAKRTHGWQLHPVFHVYQHEDHRAVLEAIAAHLSTGRIRPKGGASRVLTYAVDGLRELDRHVLPFFERYPLVVKDCDFRRFAEIVRSMRRREHWTPAGFQRLVHLAFEMNARGKQRARDIDEILAGSSETARQVREIQTIA